MTDIEALRKRVVQLKESIWSEPGDSGKRSGRNIQGGVQTALSILSAVYGPTSNQVRSFQDRLKKGVGRHDDADHQYDTRLAGAIESSVDAAVADLDAGITTPFVVHAKGEILADFVTLAREALDTRTTGADRVAAVLVAAALEETLKQLGALRGVDVYSRDMRGVIQKLCDAELLVGAQFSLAQGFVKFRDHAFHGQFDEISRVTSESALTFVDGLLSTAFR